MLNISIFFADFTFYLYFYHSWSSEMGRERSEKQSNLVLILLDQLKKNFLETSQYFGIPTQLFNW